VPGGLAVEESAGGELVAHGFEERMRRRCRLKKKLDGSEQSVKPFGH
jgi:hypothetical protein